MVCAVAYLTRGTITPDAVAYLENAELFAHGRWLDALQGYWSPGYSLLLVPAVWLAGDDRGLLLDLAHVVQALVGVAALGVAVAAVRKRVPPAAQRAIYWTCAWIVVRWLSQEFLSPDLLLCALLLVFIARFPAEGMREEVLLGGIVGAGFLVKTSIWPWLAVAVAVVAVRVRRSRDAATFPRGAALATLAVSGGLVLALSVRAGHFTLGSVGPLNARWYLGDLTRRTPDTDTGPHATKRHLITPPGGDPVDFHDLRQSWRTYAPWSDPEGWARGVPPDARPAPDARQAWVTWRQNVRVMLPLALPLAIVLVVGVRSRRMQASGIAWWDRALDRPMLLVGTAAALIFLLVHVEARLIAPAALLGLFGAWGGAEEATAPASRSLLAMNAMMVVFLLQAAQHFRELPAKDISDELDRYFDEQRAQHSGSGVVIVGSGTAWMGALWRHHLRVVAQVGLEGATQLRRIGAEERRRLLRLRFEPDAIGVAEAFVYTMPGAGRAVTERTFTAW